MIFISIILNLTLIDDSANLIIWWQESEKQIGFRNQTVRDRKWQSVGQIRQLGSCSTDNAMRMDQLTECSYKEQ